MFATQIAVMTFMYIHWIYTSQHKNLMTSFLTYKMFFCTDVSYITNVMELVVLNISMDSDSSPDVMVETFSMSVIDK